MVSRHDKVTDLEAALAATVLFAPDPSDSGWYSVVWDDGTLYVRLGNFPEEELYSLYLGDGRWMNFTETPERWMFDSSADWPATARARLSKGHFHL